jgi:Dockerin type I domain
MNLSQMILRWRCIIASRAKPQFGTTSVRRLLRVIGILGVFALVRGTVFAVDIDPGFLVGAMDQPQINVSLSRTATGPAIVSPDGFDPNTGASINTINFQAFLDTGASGILFAKETQDSFHLNLSTFNGANVVYSDVGVGGTQDFNVSEPLYVRLGAYNPTTQDQLESPAIYTQQTGPVLVQIAQTESQSLLTDPINVVGTPVMRGKVVVVDNKPLNSLADDLHTGKTDLFTAFFTRPDDFSLRSYIYTPGDPNAAFNPNSDSNPGIPDTNLHVKLTSVSFNRFTSVTPAGATGPVLANNPFIGPNPVLQLDPNAPVDNTPKIKVAANGLSTQGSFLLDTGSAASVISTKLASQLHIFNQDPNDPSSPLVYNAPGMSSPLVPNQFQLTVTGVGGDATRNGFYLDSLFLPTIEGGGRAGDSRNIQMLHVPVLVDDITVRDPTANVSLTLDGVFGMNLMTATESVPDPNDPLGNLDLVRGAFDYLSYDQANNVLGLALNKDFHIAGDFDLNGKISNADLQAMLDAIKNLDAFAAAHNLSSSDALALADLNQDGVVNAADVQILMNMLTQTSTSPQSVPEPAGWLLMVFVGVALAINRVADRRRHS